MGSGAFKVEVDLMQPMDPEKKPAVHTTPLNHVGLWVDDLPVAVQWLTAQGVRFAPGGIRKGAAGYDICFIHPKGNEGTADRRRRRADRTRAGTAPKSSRRSARSRAEHSRRRTGATLRRCARCGSGSVANIFDKAPRNRSAAVA